MGGGGGVRGMSKRPDLLTQGVTVGMRDQCSLCGVCLMAQRVIGRVALCVCVQRIVYHCLIASLSQLHCIALHSMHVA